ncbi:cofactor-independent phosphoglycerate mutase [Vallitalea okinawensis]|uniref:cofactor-independent phosphoglycerate mutase n=1 Tax=Vallitalea okinawensis TaxID=2078660 RepID=UPI000CFBF4A6|nr:cofactor-independent phosphoglycerate mutase [Vallitalea okinawensis]
MKYIVVLGDGMADEPIDQLNGKTPLEVALTPNMDFLAQNGELGMVQTIPRGMSPGSDTANLSVLGYDPKKYYTGRSPLEALSQGISLKEGDVTFRANLVTLSEEVTYEDKKLLDHSGGEISTEEAKVLINYLKEHLDDEMKQFHTGVSYRHILLWNQGSIDVKLIPPHDIRNQNIKNHLPKGDNSDIILSIMKRSFELLKDHPINRERMEEGLLPANSLWIWGEGTKPVLDRFHDKYDLDGAMISAVDLLNGMALGADLQVIAVEGATGNIHTNFIGKANAAVQCLKEKDFVYIHIEAPDECGHAGELHQKIRAIELIDEQIVGNLLAQLNGQEFRILLLPDHATPIRCCTHTDSPVPFAIYDSSIEVSAKNMRAYNEISVAKEELVFNEGYTLMDYFVKGGKRSC